MHCTFIYHLILQIWVIIWFEIKPIPSLYTVWHYFMQYIDKFDKGISLPQNIHFFLKHNGCLWLKLYLLWLKFLIYNSMKSAISYLVPNVLIKSGIPYVPMSWIKLSCPKCPNQAWHELNHLAPYVPITLTHMSIMN